MATPPWLTQLLAQYQQNLAGQRGPSWTAASTPQDAPGSLGDLSEGARVLLGRGVARKQIGDAPAPIDTPFKRSVERGQGGLLEVHDYGGGVVKKFARKNPGLLDLAGRLAMTGRQGGAAAQGATDEIGALSPEEQERVRYLLGR